MNSQFPDGRILHLPVDLRDVLVARAEQARPKECCGLVVGDGAPAGWRVTGITAGPNRSVDPVTGFAIDVKLHFDLQRKLRPGPSAVIGCYHSHPDGPAFPSRTDLDAMTEAGFLWLIAGQDPDRRSGWTLRAYCAAGPGDVLPLTIRLEAAVSG